MKEKNTPNITDIPPKKDRRPNRQKVDVKRAVDLKVNHNLSYRQIAQLEGVTAQAVHQQIGHLLPTEAVQYYQRKKTDILDTAALKVLSQIDDRRLKKLSGRDAAVSFGILYDKSRLEQGQSTGNLAILGSVEVLTRRAGSNNNLRNVGIISTSKDK
jgi:hypothetical protein